MAGDIFVPNSQPEDARVGPLKMITYVTSDPQTAHTLLVDGMGLRASDWYSPSQDSKSDMDTYFGFKKGQKWKAHRYDRSDDGANIALRLIAVEGSQAQVRPEIDGTYVGGLSVGFPLGDSDAREARMSKLGFSSIVGVKRLEFSRPSGETYVSEEVHFTGPENIYFLGVKRPDIFVPVGPLNAEDAIGAAAYSAICVDDCDASMAFLRDVLGYEIRRDMTMEVGDKSGLKLRKGSQERFVQAFAPGSRTGYLVLLDHFDERKRAAGIENLGPPTKGLAMWSFPSSDLNGVYERAKSYEATIRQAIAIRKTPFLPETETLIIEDPSGFPIEIYTA